MTDNERIIKLMEYTGLSLNRLAIEIGLKTPQTFYDIRNGKHRISKDLAERIKAKYLNISITWLLTGEGSMLKADETEMPNTPKEPPAYTVYLLPMSAMGGPLTGFAADGVTLSNCEKVVSPIDDVDFAITVYGESMAPKYPSGTRVLIKRINPDIFIDWGKSYVLDTSNGVIVKELRKAKKEGYVACYSINPDPKFEPFDVPLSEVNGVYRVLMSLSAE